MSRLGLAIVLVALAVTAGACGGSSTKQSQSLADLRGIAELQAAFNRASGEPRLIVLVSPT